MTAYYNELEAYPAEWLRNLSAANRITPGVVDQRSITDVRADDVRGAIQAHFFAGIGIWSLALRMAGWPDDKPVWTGSCPCQPFSEAGKGEGFADERHLWPEWFRLIRECRPEYIFGEQVQSAAGGAWLDLVHANLESVDYAVGAVVLPAAGVGAPNIRQRIFFGAKWLGDTLLPGGGRDTRGGGRQEGPSSGSGLSNGCVGHPTGASSSDGPAQPGGLGNPRCAGLPERPLADDKRGTLRLQGPAACPTGPLRPWQDLEWLDCSDGKRRPTQPGLFPLATRHTGRVALVRPGGYREISATGALRAAGNAISPQVASVFVRAFMEELS